MKEVQTLDGVLKIELFKITRTGHHEYDVYLEEGVWPTDYDLVTIADGGDPDRPWEDQMHNGGKVLPGETIRHKIVHVY